MANTYSSWEYSQGPHLYIDSSGFESIDDKKNFVYYYEVTYSPVEYKRKVTTDKGSSYYEYRYSFGDNNAARRLLGRYTFSGKDKITKTVTHAVNEEGFYKNITKTFVIDTNLTSNIQSNSQVVVKPTQMINTFNWEFDRQNTITLPNKDYSYLGWVSITKTGYRTETSYYYETYTYTYYTTIPCPFDNDGPDGFAHTHRVQKTGTATRRVPYNYTVAYDYVEVHNSFCRVSFKEARNKLGDFANLSSICLRFRIKEKINKAPTVYLDTDISATSARKTLSCSQSGAINANSIIEYYIPMSYLYETFKNNDTMFFIIDKGNCSSANCYISEAYMYIYTQTESIPYMNLLVQAYNSSTNQWNTACTIPYLNYKEIESMRNDKKHISKNLFLPSNLPRSDAGYRIAIDTNLTPKETERLTNFRMDVLSQQLIQPGSITDKKLYLCNDSLTFENEIEVSEIDELKLNILGNSKFKEKPYAGFLKQGANDVHAYLKNTVTVIDKNIPEENVSKNVWYGYINKTNGSWVSNNTFIANTFNIGNVGILQGNDSSLQNDLIVFNFAYNQLKPHSLYTMKFDVLVEQAFENTSTPTINEKDVSKVIKTRLYTESSSDTNKVLVTHINEVFYTPIYKIKHSTWTEMVNEYNRCNKIIPISISFNTGNLQPDDNGIVTLKIKSAAMSNILIKNMQVECIDENNEKYVDVIEPYNSDIYTGREYETFMTIYYDGFNFQHINPMLYKDMVYLRNGLNKIRADYGLELYPWSEWNNSYDSQGNLIIDENGHGLGVEVDQPLRAVHFNDGKACCVKTYEDLLGLKPPVDLNTSPSQMRDNTGLVLFDEADPSKGFILQHVVDREGNQMEVDKYFPEWKQIIELINRN